MPAIGGAVRKRKSKAAARRGKSRVRKSKSKSATHHKRRVTSKYSSMSSDQLRKLSSRHNRGKPKEKRIKTLVKVRKGSKVVTRPKKKAALVAACKKHKL
jgi:hypothetical protein